MRRKTLLCTILAACADAVHAQPGGNTAWAHIVVYAGMAAIIFYLGYVLVSSGEGPRDLDEKKRKLASLFFLITLATFALTGGVDWLGSVTGVGWLYDTSSEFLNDQVSATTDTFASVLGVYEVMALVSTLKIGISLGISAEVKAGELLRPISKVTEILLWSAWGFVTSMSIHKVILDFGHRYAMGSIFPLGLLFYILPGLRRAGAFLISVSIALWIFFPLTVVAVMIPVSDMIKTDPQDYYDINVPIGDVYGSLGTLANPVAAPPAVSGIFLKTTKEAFVNFVFEWWAEKAMLWYFVPVINVVFFIILVLGLTEAIGGESNVLGRMSRVMVPFR
jgi:hypothetical protein